MIHADVMKTSSSRSSSRIMQVNTQLDEAFTYRWERVIDFLKLHYVLSERLDSDYWIDNLHRGRTTEITVGITTGSGA